MKKFFALLLSLVLLLSFSSVALAETVSLPNPLCSANSNTCINDFPSLIAAVTGFVFDAIGFLAVIMFIYAGILFVMSAGEPSKVDHAKQALKWAIIGVAIAFLGNGLILVVKSVIGVTPA